MELVSSDRRKGQCVLCLLVIAGRKGLYIDSPEFSAAQYANSHFMIQDSRLSAKLYLASCPHGHYELHVHEHT